MNDDDAPKGVVLTRREAVALLGLSAAGMLTHYAPSAAYGASPATSCVVRPEQTEGPFFVDDVLKRSDIRAGRPGQPLEVTFNVLTKDNRGCTPLAGAHVDLWQCDAEGVYSDDSFLRGYQMTDASGAAMFTTIYPGWYPGRTVHIHFKIRSDPRSARGYEFASQLYFDDGLTDRVHALAPYSSRGARRVRNQRDGIYRRGGDQLMLSVAENGARLASTFSVAMEM